MPRVLGLDYGERRLGFAVSDTGGIVALPLVVVHVTSDREAAAAVREQVAAAQAEKLVIGLPINMNGSLGPVAQHVKSFVELLQKQLSIPVETWDERLTTKSAEDVLIGAGASRKRRREVVDKLAAQIMLQHYLDAHAGLQP